MNLSSSGRPLRFFGLLMLAWLTVRLTSMDAPGLPPIAPTASWTNRMTALPSPLRKLARASHYLSPVRLRSHRRTLAAWKPSRSFPRRMVAPMARQGDTPVDLSRFLSEGNRFAPQAATAIRDVRNELATSAPSPLATPYPNGTDRWRASGWLLWRSGNIAFADLISTGRLGGSQAGFRLDFDLTPAGRGRVAAYGRVSSALNQPASPEMALGMSFQPARIVPVSLALERRISLGDGGRNANAALIVGGFNPTPVLGAIRAEGYAQAGAVGFRNRDLFVDGKLSLLADIDASPVRLGGSISGGAQPDVERLDIGPEVRVRLPIQDAAARLSIEWRERIAGQAAPPSGLAVTLGADF